MDLSHDLPEPRLPLAASYCPVIPAASELAGQYVSDPPPALYAGMNDEVKKTFWDRRLSDGVAGAALVPPCPPIRIFRCCSGEGPRVGTVKPCGSPGPAVDEIIN